MEPTVFYQEKDIRQKAFEENWGGNGTANDPHIIDSYENFPTELRIYQSNLYISIKNCNLKYLTMKKCRNTTLENCVEQNLYREKYSYLLK